MVARRRGAERPVPHRVFGGPLRSDRLAYVGCMTRGIYPLHGRVWNRHPDNVGGPEPLLNHWTADHLTVAMCATSSLGRSGM
jgi:hypothetical protein